MKLFGDYFFLTHFKMEAFEDSPNIAQGFKSHLLHAINGNLLVFSCLERVSINFFFCKAEYMNIYPQIEQRFSPFEFYSTMRKNNPIVFDEENKQWALYRYSDIEKILQDPVKFSSKFGLISNTPRISRKS